MLKIVKSFEPLTIDNIVITIYAAPGLGKSTLGFTADSPLLLDFDHGAHRAANRKDSVPIKAWEDVAGMTAEDLAPYKTIVVDTAGRALDSMSLDIIDRNPKHGRNGALTLQGFGELKSRFAQWQTFLRSLGKDLVLICHMDEQRNGDETQERIDAQGSSKNEIYKSSDAMCRIQIDARGGRFLDFDPREGGYGKNPAQLPKIAFPHPDVDANTLANIITRIKDSINKTSQVQAEAAKESEDWKTAVADAESLDDINLLVSLAKDRKLKAPLKALLTDRAKELGMTFDRETGKYAMAEVEA
ncbi:MAG: ATP-binding protein [Patescibacteria group bacterium]|nr:ATP-binding protein [Patescibacteria group bacterium]